MTHFDVSARTCLLALLIPCLLGCDSEPAGRVLVEPRATPSAEAPAGGGREDSPAPPPPSPEAPEAPPLVTLTAAQAPKGHEVRYAAFVPYAPGQEFLARTCSQFLMPTADGVIGTGFLASDQGRLTVLTAGPDQTLSVNHQFDLPVGGDGRGNPIQYRLAIQDSATAFAITPSLRRVLLFNPREARSASDVTQIDLSDLKISWPEGTRDSAGREVGGRDLLVNGLTDARLVAGKLIFTAGNYIGPNTPGKLANAPGTVLAYAYDRERKTLGTEARILRTTHFRPTALRVLPTQQGDALLCLNSGTRVISEDAHDLPSEASIDVIDPGSFRLVARIPLPGALAPTQFVISRDRTRAYLGSGLEAEIYEVDLRGLGRELANKSPKDLIERCVRALRLPLGKRAGNHPYNSNGFAGLGLSDDGNYLLGLIESLGEVFVIDLATREIAAQIGGFQRTGMTHDAATVALAIAHPRPDDAPGPVAYVVTGNLDAGDTYTQEGGELPCRIVIDAIQLTPAPRAPAASPPALGPPEPLPAGLQRGPGPGEFTNPKDGSVLVWVPAARIRLASRPGHPASGHSLNVPNGYFMGKYEVSVAQYERFCEATKHRPPHDPNVIPAVPVANVSWDDAVAYTRWAGLALPNEAEWELAARGPKGLVYPWGDEFAAERANVAGEHVLPCGSFPLGASPSGCLDMLGNVTEWTADYYAPLRRGKVVVGGPAEGKARVMRGGYYGMDPTTHSGALSARTREPGLPTLAQYNIGFRVCLRVVQVIRGVAAIDATVVARKGGVRISVGSDDRVIPGLYFWIYRGGKRIGRVVADEVDRDMSRCRVLSQGEGDGAIRPGDSAATCFGPGDVGARELRRKETPRQREARLDYLEARPAFEAEYKALQAARVAAKGDKAQLAILKAKQRDLDVKFRVMIMDFENTFPRPSR
ncbi:MAG: SUMF1/EgtB/PvdO family nonheme iron enzyme [Planctomycetes bacterium]|nr:SUMF1/EgtB/PvdO family nonheme iron enzyme [Planctomycetota bacterium]